MELKPNIDFTILQIIYRHGKQHGVWSEDIVRLAPSGAEHVLERLAVLEHNGMVNQYARSGSFRTNWRLTEQGHNALRDIEKEENDA
jgi:DNA-binding IclR family transcriptional regulator